MAVVAVPFILYLVRFCSPKPCKYIVLSDCTVYFVFSTFLLFQILYSYEYCTCLD